MPNPTSQLLQLQLAIVAFALLSAYGADAQDAQLDPTALFQESLEHSGAVIGEIFIDPQNIFDLNDTRENNQLFRLGNALHIKTRENVIRQQLLFKPGDPYSARQLEESERILRSARYLYDASIKPMAVHDGVVDVSVVTRDVWTLNPGLSFGRHGGENTFGFELEELNLLGTGTSISASHKSGIDRSSDLIEFKDQHLFGTWSSLDAAYSDNSDGYTRELHVEHPFYALDTRWAAGVSGVDDERIEPLYDLGHIVDQFRAQTREVEIYGGWSRGLVDGWTRRWTWGMTYQDDQFAPDPGWEGSSLIPQDRRFIYPWIGVDLVQDSFEKTVNRDQIGRTEDFHLGTRLSARIGWSDASIGSASDALLFMASAERGAAVGERSTVLFTSKLSGRLEDGQLRNAVLSGATRYYLKQSSRQLFFVTLDAAVGDELDLDNQILLGGDNGLRGYPLRYQGGDARALLTVEQRYFTDWYPFRLFRVGAAAFFDVGRTWGTSPVSTPSLGLLKDIGIGLRIGNSRSGLGNVIHVDIAMPLDGDSSINTLQFLVETKRSF